MAGHLWGGSIVRLKKLLNFTYKLSVQESPFLEKVNNCYFLQLSREMTNMKGRESNLWPQWYQHLCKPCKTSKDVWPPNKIPVHLTSWRCTFQHAQSVRFTSVVRVPVRHWDKLVTRNHALREVQAMLGVQNVLDSPIMIYTSSAICDFNIVQSSTLLQNYCCCYCFVSGVRISHKNEVI